jgi:hypothetical protein
MVLQLISREKASGKIRKSKEKVRLKNITCHYYGKVGHVKHCRKSLAD